MTNYQRGTAKERCAIRRRESEGWFVIRAPGSKGAADFVALRLGSVPQLVQVKGNARGAFSSFPPAERRELIRIARIAGGVAVLEWWPPGTGDKSGPAAVIPSADWPPS